MEVTMKKKLILGIMLIAGSTTNATIAKLQTFQEAQTAYDKKMIQIKATYTQKTAPAYTAYKQKIASAKAAYKQKTAPAYTAYKKAQTVAWKLLSEVSQRIIKNTPQKSK
jgi:hypothetical protein